MRLTRSVVPRIFAAKGSGVEPVSKGYAFRKNVERVLRNPTAHKMEAQMGMRRAKSLSPRMGMANITR
jgi:hypothetical protein